MTPSFSLPLNPSDLQTDRAPSEHPVSSVSWQGQKKGAKSPSCYSWLCYWSALWLADNPSARCWVEKNLTKQITPPYTLTHKYWLRDWFFLDIELSDMALISRQKQKTGFSGMLPFCFNWLYQMTCFLYHLIFCFLKNLSCSCVFFSITEWHIYVRTLKLRKIIGDKNEKKSQK